MSNSLLKRVYKLEMHCTYERHVLQRLADRTNDKTGVCWPSVGSLARDICCSKRTVQGAINGLIRRGWVNVEKNAGRNGCNLYRLTLPPALDAPLHVVHPSSSDAAPPQVSPNTPAPNAPEPKRTIKKTLPRKDEKQGNDLVINAIKDGKGFLVQNVSANTARTMVDNGHVTEAQCKAVGIL